MEFESRHRGWSYGCSATSPMAAADLSHPIDVEALWNKPKTFIWDHKLSMDPCLHPNHTQLNGFLYGHGAGPVPTKSMVPAFAICTTHLHADILTVAPEMWTEKVGIDPPWDEKEQDTLLWRGRNTGVHFSTDGRWNMSQRIRLVQAVNEEEGYVPVLTSTSEPREPVGLPRNASRGALNEALMDIGFSGHAIQCVPEVCAVVEETYTYKESQTFQGANQWKYILDVSTCTEFFNPSTYQSFDRWTETAGQLDSSD